MIRIYHFDHKNADRDLSYKVFAGKEVPEFTKKNYKMVALVSVTGDVERAYYLTNHIDHDWTENDGVTAVGGPHRSSSVGDVFVMENGDRLVCASMGFNKVEGKGGLE